MSLERHVIERRWQWASSVKLVRHRPRHRYEAECADPRALARAPHAGALDRCSSPAARDRRRVIEVATQARARGAGRSPRGPRVRLGLGAATAAVAALHDARVVLSGGGAAVAGAQRRLMSSAAVGGMVAAMVALAVFSLALVWLAARGHLRKCTQADVKAWLLHPRWRRVPSQFLPSTSTSSEFESLDDAMYDENNEDLFIGAAGDGIEIRGLSGVNL